MPISVVILCGVESFIRHFMIQAYKRSLCNGDYVYLTTDLLPSTNWSTRWKTGAEDDDLARKAYWPLLKVRLVVLVSVERSLDILVDLAAHFKRWE